MRALGDPHATTHHDAVEQRDVRLWVAEDRVIECVLMDEESIEFVLMAVPIRFVQEAHVAACTERPRVSRQHDDCKHVWIFAPLLERGTHRVDHAARQRV